MFLDHRNEWLRVCVKRLGFMEVASEPTLTLQESTVVGHVHTLVTCQLLIEQFSFGWVCFVIEVDEP